MTTSSFTPLDGNENVLLIDDEKPILSMVTQMLRRCGYHVSPYDKSSNALGWTRTAETIRKELK